MKLEACESFNLLPSGPEYIPNIKFYTKAFDTLLRNICKRFDANAFNSIKSFLACTLSEQAEFLKDCGITAFYTGASAKARAEFCTYIAQHLSDLFTENSLKELLKECVDERIENVRTENTATPYVVSISADMDLSQIGEFKDWLGPKLNEYLDNFFPAHVQWDGSLTIMEERTGVETHAVPVNAEESANSIAVCESGNRFILNTPSNAYRFEETPTETILKIFRIWPYTTKKGARYRVEISGNPRTFDDVSSIGLASKYSNIIRTDFKTGSIAASGAVTLPDTNICDIPLYSRFGSVVKSPWNLAFIGHYSSNYDESTYTLNSTDYGAQIPRTANVLSFESIPGICKFFVNPNEMVDGNVNLQPNGTIDLYKWYSTNPADCVDFQLKSGFPPLAVNWCLVYAGYLDSDGRIYYYSPMNGFPFEISIDGLSGGIVYIKNKDSVSHKLSFVYLRHESDEMSKTVYVTSTQATQYIQTTPTLMYEEDGTPAVYNDAKTYTVVGGNPSRNNIFLAREKSLETGNIYLFRHGTRTTAKYLTLNIV